ncbi:MAG: hypothetical protein ACOX7N_06455 [Lawsonibacter sp.]|jgi:hypothetical protein
MEFSYRINPLAYAKYMFYTFRFVLLLLPAIMCPTLVPTEEVNIPLHLFSSYVILLLSLCALTLLISVPFSLLVSLCQRQAGTVSIVHLDDTGLTETWRDRQVHILWSEVKRATVRSCFLKLKASKTQWFLFRGSVDRETFLALSQFIRSHTAVH